METQLIENASPGIEFDFPWAFKKARYFLQSLHNTKRSKYPIPRLEGPEGLLRLQKRLGIQKGVIGAPGKTGDPKRAVESRNL